MESKSELNTEGSNIIYFSYRNKNVNFSQIEYLVKNKAALNTQTTKGKTSLHLECEKEDVSFEIVKLFVENKSDLNVQDINGDTAIHYLTKTDKNLEILKFLCKKKNFYLLFFFF